MAVSLFLIVNIPLCAIADPASPAGEWLVKDKTAHIRVAFCDKKLWGTISWAKTPDTDKNNPDSSRRNQPILGLPILLAMQSHNSNQWTGEIYNAENGKLYDSDVSLKSADVLHVHGCVLYGLLCGSEDWTRLETPADQELAETLCRRIKNLSHLVSINIL